MNATFLNASVVNDSEALFQKYINKFFYGYYYQIYHPTTVVLFVCGVISNIINVLVFTRRKMRNSLTFLLCSLAVSDFVFFSFRVAQPIIYYLSPTQNVFVSWYSVVWSGGLYPAENTTILVSSWMNVVIGAWRFVAVTWPLKSKEWCSVRRAKVVTAFIVIVSSLASLMGLSYITTHERTLNGRPVTVINTRQYTGWQFIVVHRVFKVITLLLGILPMFLLLILTVGLFWKLKSAADTRQKISTSASEDNSFKITRMLAVILVIFILTNTPSAILNITYFLKLEKIVVYRTIFLILQEVDKATNFFIYIIMSSKYREAFDNIFLRTKPNLFKSSLNISDTL